MPYKAECRYTDHSAKGNKMALEAGMTVAIALKLVFSGIGATDDLQPPAELERAFRHAESQFHLNKIWPDLPKWNKYEAERLEP